MKLGISMTLPHTSAQEWAEKHSQLGLSSVVFPCNYTEDTATIDAYVQACKDYGLLIAEVGAWKNLLAPDEKEREANFAFCRNQLELAEYVGAACCVTISGAKGPVWDAGYPDNYSEKTYAEIIDNTRRLIDSVNPKKTFYTLEPMPWMHPDSPEDYLQMVKDVDRAAFGVHLDIINMINSPQKYLFNRQFTADAVSLLGKHIRSCHMKDTLMGTGLTVSLREVPCGEGGFDLKNYMELIDRLNPDLPMIIEHLDAEEEYKNAVAYIKKLAAE